MIVVWCPSCGEALDPRLGRPDGTGDCPKCGHAVTFPTNQASAETVAAPPDVADPDRTLTAGGGPRGTGPTAVSVPGYEVLEELGRGGMGVVYKARQFNPPRTVALKMILAGEHASPEQLSRFHAEAEATARLTHPAIVQIHQVGDWQPAAGVPPVPFLTLEYVEGQPLSRRLDRGPAVNPRQAADLVRQLARGVHYAHQQGIIHRDLKPGNVLLTGRETADSLGEPKVVDFGLAKPLDGFATLAGGAQTQTGTLLGTPSYMAPEQARGKAKVGPATDVYALGAILYELLTGRPPFLADSAVETLLRVAKDDPEPPRRVKPGVPRDLETICLCCLAKDPARRYASAAALADDLGRFLDGEAVSVRAPSGLERAVRWARRRKELLYLAAGAVAAAAVIAAIVLTRPDPPETTQNPAPPPSPPPDVRPPIDDTPIAESRRRMVSANNLKQLLIALHNMHDAYNELPPAAITDKTGKPLLSWRVAILPYIEQDDLYKQFKLDEPWDSLSNMMLVQKMPPTFTVEGQSAAPAGRTHYQAVVGPGTAWEVQPQLGGSFGRRGLRFPAFTDGTSMTIMLAEAADPVIWTKPEDVTFDGKQLPRFGGVVKNGFNVGLADGSVTFVRQSVDPANLRFALTRNGGEVLPNDWNELGQATGPVRVMGRVTYNGRPLVGGWVTFNYEGPAQKEGVGVTIHPDGKYDVVTGLEPGRYRVAIVPPKDPAGRSKFPAIPGRYTDMNTSTLTVDVKPGSQEVNFDLTDSAPAMKQQTPGGGAKATAKQ